MDRRLTICAGIVTAVACVGLGLSGVTRASGRASRRLDASVSDPADAAGPLDIRAASLQQVARRLVLKVRTDAAWQPAQLEPLPNFADQSAQFLCFSITRVGASGETRICPGGSDRQVGLIDVAADGSVTSAQTIGAKVTQPHPDQAVISLGLSATSLAPGAYKWRVLSQWSGPQCAGSTKPCTDSAPDKGAARFRLFPLGPIGCTRKGPELNFNGPNKHKAVALTFDDGPSDFTPQVLSILRREHAKGTFFEIGQEVAGRERVMRNILASGDEIGNHTTHHMTFPGYSDLVETTRIIRDATGFTPCLFRPPDGSFNSGTLAAARQAKLKTIIWDVDTRDWSLPGTGTIVSRATAVHPGDIVIMHDGGGDRSETVAALPQIINNLRHRGYKFDTVSQLLGDKMIVGPVG